MAKKIKAYAAKLINAVPVNEKIGNDWSWRKDCIGMEGDLLILESEHKHPGERFLYLQSKDDMCLKTSYGTYERSENHLTFITKQSIYTFEIVS